MNNKLFKIGETIQTSTPFGKLTPVPVSHFRRKANNNSKQRV